MVKILFVCLGNICRSPMAEFVMKDLVKKAGISDRVHVASAAVSREEIGNDVYPPAKRELAAHGVRCENHRARQITAADYDRWDYLIGMDMSNITRMLRIFGHDDDHKVYRLMDFTGCPADVSDPWYSDRFDIAYRDILAGCEALLRHIENT